MVSRAVAQNRPIRRSLKLDAGAFLVCVLAVSIARAENDPPAPATADRLLHSAAEAAALGDAPRQFAMLREAVRVAPDQQLARWQLGQVKSDDEWLTAEEFQRRAAADPHQAEYRALCEKFGETPEGQLALARWCRKNNLEDEARFHWASVLSVDPANEEALRAVNMRWQNGQLMTPAQIKKQKEQLREAKVAEKRWVSPIAKWRRAVASSDPAKRGQSLDEIRALTATDVIRPLEKLTLGREVSLRKPPLEIQPISAAFLEALAKMPDQAAAESLVRHAVYSPLDGISASAIEKLKQKPLQEYVPLLLSGLAMPIESSFHVKTEPDGSVHYWHSLYREGAETDWALDLRHSAVQHDLGSRRYIIDEYTDTMTVAVSPEDAVAAAIDTARIATGYGHRFSTAATATESQIGQLNQALEAFNVVITNVLQRATGQKLGESPKAWWDWWKSENEYYASEDQPVERYYDTDTDTYYHGGSEVQYISTRPPPPRPPRQPGQMSCFAKGTLVWTKTGKRPIETLALGEQVLAQDVTTGELVYKPVIGRTVRPPSAILKLRYGSEQLRTTLGHPFWVVGVGWRMAKELGDNAVLHGVTGSQRVESVAPDGEEEAFNLVVADFDTYFVSESGVLVHDNTARQPTRVALPGLAAK